MYTGVYLYIIIIDIYFLYTLKNVFELCYYLLLFVVSI